MSLFSSDENDFGSRKNTGVLYGTVVTYECDPEEDCKNCGATGKCPTCDGEGSKTCEKCGGHGKCPTCNGEGASICEECHGDGDCQNCHGEGGHTCESHGLFGAFSDHCNARDDTTNVTTNVAHCGGNGVCARCHGRKVVWVAGSAETCRACGGSGECRHCNGTGTIKCSSCHGNGKCKHCHGTGQIQCGDCGGNGECDKCGGNGQIQCGDCDGSGECKACEGHGRVECTRCEGTGAYQQFTTYTIKGIRKDGCFTGSLDCAKCIREATGEVIFDGVQKKWATANEVELDCMDEVQQKGMSCDGQLYAECDQQYREFLESKSPTGDNVFPYRKTIKIENVPLAKIEYVLDGKPYVMYLMGNNNTVACEEVPKSIEALKLSFFEKTKLLAMSLFRKKEYAQLAYYIFKLDGVADAESRMLNVAIKKCCSSPENEAKFRDELKKFDPATMSFEVLRKQMKALFVSKKLIAFVWQCIAVDKVVSPKEEEFFNKVVAEYKNVPPDQVGKIKALAARIAMLSDEEILDEYLTIRN